MIETLKNWDTQLFLFLNGKHNAFWDFVMFWASEKLIWIPLYILLFYLIFSYYKKNGWWIIPAGIIMVALTDQLSVHAFKNIVMRLRPCHEPGLEGLVHLVKNKCGGDFGFVSSHAVNHFAIAGFFSVIFYKKIRFFIPAVMLWATLISYSRIYLGVHYPGDVICGGIVGLITGYLFGRLSLFFVSKKSLNLKP